ncbi:MAG TPA: sulfite dehydrogenase [Gemmatimonadales bacterium]|jgi:sulfane dehydrogenase subunit SoxC|nr:sulfite dehydrogenase [Gemmatimonadales bacterium]
MTADSNPGAPIDPARRALLAGAAAAGAAAIVGALPTSATGASQEPAAPQVPQDATKVPGGPTTAQSARSAFEQPARTPVGQLTGASYTPLHQLSGTITPTDLWFERHHNGVPQIDPGRWRLLLHGLVERPLVFTLDEVRRFPAVTRIYFLECSGNGRNGYRSPRPDMSPQQIDGMTANAEWTGVRVATLLREAGVRSGARWVLAEGGDAAVLSRSVPLAKMQDDALLVYAQNGEALRPAAGYPVRLLLPGWEGNACVKWIRRLELIAQPNMSRDETSRYTDPLPNDTARRFSFVMDVKSTLTHPTYPAVLAGAGWTELRGIAWSGRGKITRVDLSTDGGRTWSEAELQQPVLDKAHVRFTRMWKWDGRRAVVMSRATDETGATQPTLEQFRTRRGAGTDYHFNYIRAGVVEPDGRILFGVDL